MPKFKISSKFKPTGDQPGAIKGLVKGLEMGFDCQTLLGVTGSGKSLDQNEPLLLYKKEASGDLKQSVVKIGSFIDQLFSQPSSNTTISQETEIYFPAEKYFALSFSPKTCRQELKRIKSFIRHRAPTQMYAIKTFCGREALITGDHNCWVLRKGKMILVKTEEIQQCDCLPLPLSLPPQVSDLKYLNILDILKEERVFVEANSLIKRLIGLRGRKAVLAALASFYKGAGAKLFSIEKNIKGCKFPIKNLIGLLTELGYSLQEKDLAGVKVYSRDKKYFLTAKFPLNDSFLKLMGVFLAEGHSTERYFILSCYDPPIRKVIKNVLRDLGLRFSIRPSSDFQISSKLYATLLSRLLGNNSRNKRLPAFWGELSQRQLALLLRVYYEGDGGVEIGGVECVSASKELISDLAYALFRFGIWGRIRKTWKRATNSLSAGDYYYQLSISSQTNLKLFAGQISFLSERKRFRLSAELSRCPGTNVDVVPGIGKNLKVLRESLDMRQTCLAGAAEIDRAMVSMVETGIRQPSRRVFSALGDGLWGRVELLGGVELETCRALEEFTKLQNLRWTKVSVVKPINYNAKYVYDISVEENETFMAGRGGLFLHNTFTMANIIEQTQRPTLIISHNKTLAAQLCQEFRGYFPDNAVEYFVSFYDYYQPEAYIPSSDTYIEKDSAINEEIDRLRHEATMAVLERRDTIIVASVSCIYALGRKEDYQASALTLKVGQRISADEIVKHLISTKYERNDLELNRGKFRVRGDVLEIQPASQGKSFVRIEISDDQIIRISEVDAVTRKVIGTRVSVGIYPASHYVTYQKQLDGSLKAIREEMVLRVEELKRQNKLVEAQRLEQRTKYDLEMIKEMGYCSGIENYSRHLDGRKPGEPPGTLVEYFPKDCLLFIDESHVTVPQLNGMYHGDRARKQNLVDYGFRLPSALDNRPLTYKEFLERTGQTIYVSATPNEYELKRSKQVVEQIIRPTGLIDPAVEVRKPKGQVEDLIKEIRVRVEKKERILVTTLTKRMAEDLSEYLNEAGIKVRYLHSDVETLDRIEILRGLRLGKFDVLVGINLLREGLDLPEVSLVAILDADKEGFLRSETSIIQTIGRAARNINGRVILYAEKMTGSMIRALKETNRRREKQLAYNKKHKITPKTIIKEIADISDRIAESKADEIKQLKEFLPREELPQLIRALEEEMQIAATALNFEKAAEMRDKIKELKKAFGL